MVHPPKAVVRAWVEAFNRADPDALASLYTEDAVNHQVAQAPVAGREAIRRMLAGEFERATMTCIVENLFEDGEWAILEWRDPNGLRGCGFFHVRDGKIAFQRGYWDRLSLLRSQGASFESALRSERPGDAEGVREDHRDLPPSEWVVRWAPLVARGPVLDLACGRGRHSRLFLRRSLEVLAVDREAQRIEGARFLQADLEDGGPWPLAGMRFAAVVVTNYLHRPLFPRILESMEEGAVLIYETFMAGNERYGKPSNPAFLLRPGELLEAFRSLTIVAFEQGIVERPKPAAVQRLCAVRGEIDGVRIVPHDYR